MSQELTCSSLTTSNCSEWRSTQRFQVSFNKHVVYMSLPHSCTASPTSILDTWRSQGHGSSYCWLLPLDYCNSRLYYSNGMLQANFDTLQRVQNVLAQVVPEAPWIISSTNIRRDLHWLPVNHCITYKLCLITWKTLHTTQPPYLSEL